MHSFILLGNGAFREKNATVFSRFIVDWAINRIIHEFLLSVSFVIKTATKIQKSRSWRGKCLESSEKKVGTGLIGCFDTDGGHSIIQFDFCFSGSLTFGKSTCGWWVGLTPSPTLRLPVDHVFKTSKLFDLSACDAIMCAYENHTFFALKRHRSSSQSG